MLDDGRGLACCCVAPVSVATPAVIQSSGDPELRGPCPLHHTNLRLRRENERLRQQLAGGGERQAPAAEWREPGMRLIATGRSKPPTPTCQPRNTSPMPLPPRCRGRSRPRDVRAPRPAPGVPADDLDQRGELVIAAGAELEAVRGAAPEPLMAGHLVDAGDHRAGDVHRTAVGSRVSCFLLLRRIGSEVRPPTVNSRAVAPGTPDRDLVVERPRTADRVDEIDLRWFGRLRFLLRLPESAGGGSP